MSAKVEAIIEIRDQKILKETLEKMGYAYSEVHNGVQIARPYHPIHFQFDGGKVTYDNVNECEVESIKAQYSKNMVINDKTVLGETFNVTETEQMITIEVM